MFFFFFWFTFNFLSYRFLRLDHLLEKHHVGLPFHSVDGLHEIPSLNCLHEIPSLNYRHEIPSLNYLHYSRCSTFEDTLIWWIFHLHISWSASPSQQQMQSIHPLQTIKNDLDSSFMWLFLLFLFSLYFQFLFHYFHFYFIIYYFALIIYFIIYSIIYLMISLC